MEAVLYTFAMKFLNKKQLKKIKEMMNMTILGEMILKDGIKKGRKEGRKEGIEKGIEKGEERLSRLNMQLLKEKRYTDLERAAKDRSFRKKLLKELLSEES